VSTAPPSVASDSPLADAASPGGRRGATSVPRLPKTAMPSAPAA